jgi:hypothetical protein
MSPASASTSRAGSNCLPGAARAFAAVLPGFEHRQLRARRRASPAAGGARGARGGALLIGVDLVKPADVLEAAYDDALGITAAFNLNLLRHLNLVLDADFDVRDWRHVAFFDGAASRIEMHLEARHALTVRWPRRAPLRSRRAHSHGGLVQVDPRRVRSVHDAGCCATPAFSVMLAHG